MTIANYPLIAKQPINSDSNLVCSDSNLDSIPRLSYSSIQDFTRCRRRYFWSHIGKLELIETPRPFLLGKIMSRVFRILHDEEYRNSLQKKPTIEDLIVEEMPQYRGSLKAYPEPEEFDAELEALVGVARAYYSLLNSGTISYPRGKAELKWYWPKTEPVQHSFQLTGKIDLLTDSNILYEFKYSARPDNYTLFTIEDQISFYLLAEPSIQQVVLRILKKPALRPSERFKESRVTFRKRVQMEVESKYLDYIQDFCFWRVEFSPERIIGQTKIIYHQLSKAIHQYRKTENLDWFYQERTGCFSPNRCEFYAICETNTVSERLFKKKFELKSKP